MALRSLILFLAAGWFAASTAVAVDLEKSSNFERLDESARQSVARWRFVPARRGDEAIEATVIVPIVFRLEN